MGRYDRHLEGLYDLIRKDIFALCEALNFFPTGQQREILQAVQDAQYDRGPRRIAAKSGKGTGKSAVSFVIALWRALQYLDARTILTAPTMRQCREWLTRASEVLQCADPMLRRLVRVTKSRVIIGGRDDWGIQVFTATKDVAAQGIHNDHLTAIAEEASGIDRPLIIQIEGTLTNKDFLFLQIGNPNTRDCAFFDCFNSDAHRWRTFTLNAELSPIVSREHNEHLAEKYGTDSDIYRVQVLGEFPKQDPRCIMSSEDVAACFNVDLYKAAKVQTKQGSQILVARRFGMDFARYGDAENVIVRRVGDAAVKLEHYAHTDPNDVIDRAFRMQIEAGWKNEVCRYVVDAGGIGQGVMRRFYDAKKPVYEFHFGRKLKSLEFEDQQTEAWFRLAHKVRRHVVHFPKDNFLLQQLSTRQYFLTKQGKLQIESKKDYEDRGFESPDRADGMVLAFYDRVVVGGRVTKAQDSSKAVGIRQRRTA